MSKRLKTALVGGALLGIICVVGAYLRSGSSASPTFIFALWFNRVIIGLAIGAPWPAVTKSKALLRGAVLGLLVSFAFYSSTGFVDPVSFVILNEYYAKDKNNIYCTLAFVLSFSKARNSYRPIYDLTCTEICITVASKIILIYSSVHNP